MEVNLNLYINILVALIYIIFLIMAYKKGFVYEALNLILSVFSIFVAYFISTPLSNIFPLVSSEQFDDFILQQMAPAINMTLWFILTVIASRLLLLILSPWSNKVSKVPYFGFFNRLLGTILGALNATFWVVLLSMFLALPIVKNGREIRQNTILEPISNYANEAITYLTNYYNDNHLDENLKNAQQQFEIWLKDASDEYFKDNNHE